MNREILEPELGDAQFDVKNMLLAENGLIVQTHTLNDGLDMYQGVRSNRSNNIRTPSFDNEILCSHVLSSQSFQLKGLSLEGEGKRSPVHDPNLSVKNFGSLLAPQGIDTYPTQTRNTLDRPMPLGPVEGSKATHLIMGQGYANTIHNLQFDSAYIVPRDVVGSQDTYSNNSELCNTYIECQDSHLPQATYDIEYRAPLPEHISMPSSQETNAQGTNLPTHSPTGHIYVKDNDTSQDTHSSTDDKAKLDEAHTPTNKRRGPQGTQSLKGDSPVTSSINSTYSCRGYSTIHDSMGGSCVNRAIDSTALSQTSPNISLEGHVNGRVVTYFIDTGANVSTIKADIFRQIPHKVRYPPTATHVKAISAGNGQTVPVLGQVELPFSINNKVHPFQVLIIESIAYVVILGRDFLELYRAKIDLKDHKLELSFDTSSQGDFEFSYLPTEPTAEVCAVHAKCSFLIPRRTRSRVTPGNIGIIEPKAELPSRSQILGASQIVKTWDNSSV